LEPAIETRGLTRTFGPVRAVDAIDLAVPAGRVFGFLGPNGSGKTTTIRLLLGLLRPTAGEARLLGESAGPGAPVVTRVGALVERPAFYPYLSAAENLLVFGVTAGLAEGPRRIRSGALLTRVGLADVGGRGVGGFSTGMRQRLAFALALLREPELLVLDEPTNGLDPAGVVEVRRRLPTPPRQDYTPPGPEAAFARAAEHACSDTRPAVPRTRRSQGGGGDPGIGRNPRW
jgi:ABC-2 type transport system ATP-binding protein